MVRIASQFAYFLASAAMFILACAPAHANIVDTPHFKIDGVVIVWGASGRATARIGKKMRVRPTIAATSAALGPIPQIPVTGHLVPLKDDDLVALSDTYMNFHVASNTGFSIDAELIGDAGLSADALRATRFGLRANLGRGEAFGANAQYPHTEGPTGGTAQDARSLADLVSRTRVFTGNQPTAATSGSIVDQSVRFDITLDTDRASRGEIAPEILFTVFVP
jgi:hypothetical protein